MTKRSFSKQDRYASEEKAESKREKRGRKRHVGRSLQNYEKELREVEPERAL